MCNTVVINTYALIVDRDELLNYNFYEKLEHTFVQFPRYRMKKLLGYFNTKVGQKDIFKPIIIGKENLRRISNHTVIRLMNLITSKNFISSHYLSLTSPL